MKVYYEKDADLDLIKAKKIAVYGYGSQGHAHALNLKDSGVSDVVVALRDDSLSAKKAEAEGLRVMSMSDAAEWADIMMMLIPDELQADVWKNHIEQRAKEIFILTLLMQGLTWMSLWLHQKDQVIQSDQNIKEVAVFLA